MITSKEAKALQIVKEKQPVRANTFAMLYFTDPKQQYLFTSVSNQGNGACAGKKAWLCAGSLLGRLRKKNLVSLDRDYKYHITADGEKELKEFEKMENKKS